MSFIHRSHIYRDKEVAAFLPGFLLQLKSANAVDSTCHICLKKRKNQRQSPVTLGYLLVQFNFAPHPPFNLDFKQASNGFQTRYSWASSMIQINSRDLQECFKRALRLGKVGKQETWNSASVDIPEVAKMVRKQLVLLTGEYVYKTGQGGS